MTLLERMERRPAAMTMGCVAVVGGLLALHYGATLHRLGLHDLLRGLFYLPVALAAFVAGWRGGMVTACAAAIGYLPHIPQLAQAGDRVPNNLLELVLLIGVGALIGTFTDAGRRARELAAERGRLAALSEVGLGVMAQAEGPLASIEGQAESLHALAHLGRDLPVEFAAGIIQQQAARVRLLMADLQTLGRSNGRLPGRVDLSALVTGVVTDLDRSPSAEPHVVLGSVAQRVTVESDARVLAWSLRALVFGLLASDPPPRRLEVHLAASEADALLEIRAHFEAAESPDLERSLSAVLGVPATGRHFRQALCISLLAAQGAAIRFPRVAQKDRLVRISFPAARRSSTEVPRSRRDSRAASRGPSRKPSRAKPATQRFDSQPRLPWKAVLSKRTRPLRGLFKREVS